MRVGGFDEALQVRENSELLKRLLRLTAFMDFDSYDEPQLDGFVRNLRDESRVSLQTSVARQTA